MNIKDLVVFMDIRVLAFPQKRYSYIKKSIIKDYQIHMWYKVIFIVLYDLFLINITRDGTENFSKINTMQLYGKQKIKSKNAGTIQEISFKFSRKILLHLIFHFILFPPAQDSQNPNGRKNSSQQTYVHGHYN